MNYLCVSVASYSSYTDVLQLKLLPFYLAFYFLIALLH